MTDDAQSSADYRRVPPSMLRVPDLDVEPEPISDGRSDYWYDPALRAVSFGGVVGAAMTLGRAIPDEGGGPVAIGFCALWALFVVALFAYGLGKRNAQ